MTQDPQFTDADVRATPEGQRHAEEARVLSELLELNPSGSSDKESVHPTRDFRGRVVLNFAQAWDLLGYTSYEDYRSQEGD